MELFLLWLSQSPRKGLLILLFSSFPATSQEGMGRPRLTASAPVPQAHEAAILPLSALSQERPRPSASCTRGPSLRLLLPGENPKI